MKKLRFISNQARYLTAIISILIFINSNAQNIIKQVIDNKNNVPIPYVNIGIVGKNVGTVSDNNGRFQLELDNKYNCDSLRFSSIGYESLNIRVEDYKKNNHQSENNRIKMTPKIYNIEEVVVTNHKIKTVLLGNSNKNGGDIINIQPAGLGAEIGLIMKLHRKKIIFHLNNFRFNLVDNIYDTIPIRVNIYNLKNGLPNINILQSPIFFNIQKDGLITIDLKKYNIVVQEDFFISIEYIREISLNKKLRYWAVFKTFSQKGTGNCLWRDVSQGNWSSNPMDELRFSVEAEY